MASLQIEYDGQVYEFDELDLDLDEAETIQKFAGRNLGDWANGITVCEVKAMQALWWYLRKRAGEHPGAIAAKPAGFKPVRLYRAYADALQAEADRVAEEEAAAAAPDPTQLAPSPAPSSPVPAPTPTLTAPVPVPATPSLPG